MSESKHRACVHTHIPCLFGVIACYHVAGGVKAPFPCVAVECLAGSPQMFGSPVRHENIFLPIRYLGQIWTIERKRTIMAGDASERYDALVRQRPELIDTAGTHQGNSLLSGDCRDLAKPPEESQEPLVQKTLKMTWIRLSHGGG